MKIIYITINVLILFSHEDYNKFSRFWVIKVRRVFCTMLETTTEMLYGLVSLLLLSSALPQEPQSRRGFVSTNGTRDQAAEPSSPPLLLAHRTVPLASFRTWRIQKLPVLPRQLPSRLLPLHPPRHLPFRQRAFPHSLQPPTA